MLAMVLRPVLYAGASLAGVYVANELRPVNVDAGAAVGSAAAGAENALRQLGRGNFSDAWSALTGGAKSAGAEVKSSVNAQVKANVILGVVGGCLLAAVADAVLL